MKLILFDIDGTIMDSGGAGTRALNMAFEDLYSIKDAFQGIRMSGKTDTEIMKEALRKHSLPSSDGTIPRAVASYLRHLGIQINNDRKRLKPGVLELLETLSGRPDCRLGLLTGNLQEGARIKLGAFGLNRYFRIDGGSMARGKGSLTPLKSANKIYIDKPLGKVDHVHLHGVPGSKGLKSGLKLNASNNPVEGDYVPEERGCAPFGAFGSDDEDRNRLLPIAVEKFLVLTGIRVGYADCIVIGDTPRDVRCAKPYGAVALAVATGSYSMEELKEAGADVVMEDLRGGYDHLEGVI